MMKNGWAPSADGISTELLKLGGEKVLQWLLHLAHIIWEEEKVPEDWLKSWTVPLHKKGSLKKCVIYSGIALLMQCVKKSVLSGDSERAEQVLRTEKCGFHKGRLHRPDLHTQNPSGESKEN